MHVGGVLSECRGSVCQQTISDNWEALLIGGILLTIFPGFQ